MFVKSNIRCIKSNIVAEPSKLKSRSCASATSGSQSTWKGLTPVVRRATTGSIANSARGTEIKHDNPRWGHNNYNTIHFIHLKGINFFTTRVIQKWSKALDIFKGNILTAEYVMQYHKKKMSKHRGMDMSPPFHTRSCSG